MADNKDNKTPGKGPKKGLSTSSSLDKPLLDENAVEETADIDTSHLTVDDSAAQADNSLESAKEQKAPAINTSHLSVEKSSTAKKPGSPDDFDSPEDSVTDQAATGEKLPDFPKPDQDPAESHLDIKNPLASKSSAETAADKPASSKPKNDTDEQQHVITSGIPDEEFDQELEGSKTDKSTPDNDFDDEDEDEDSESPIKSILETVKKPENVVRSAWSSSSARRYLLENVDSYRKKDEDQNMEEAIEKVYGGTVESKISPGKFIKENILFSFLIFVLLFLIGWKAAGILFPNFMPEINDQIIATVQKQTSSKPKKKKVEKKAIVTNQENKALIDSTLSHCLIEPGARTQFSTAFKKVGYEYSNKPLTLSYEETRDSIKVWESMNMDFYITDARLRFRELAVILSPVIEDARKTVNDYSQSLVQLSDQARDLKTRIRGIKTSKGNQSIDTINERMPLRAELDELNSRLAQEPRQERFIQLLAKLALVENILSGQDKPDRLIPDEVTKNDPQWLTSISETSSKDIGVLINEKVIPTIQVPADNLKKVFPKLTAFNLSELETALDDLLKLSSLIIYLPENQLIPYKLELYGLNRRLNKLMKKDLPQWINFDRCLTTMRSGVSATPQ